LEKLEFYGIVGIFKTLIKSYLMGRNQRVILDQRTEGNNSSKWEIIKCGVPQGSILGRLFFLIYVNDLSKIINTDTNKTNFEKNLNHTFKDINVRFNVNSLNSYFSKTQYLEFRLKKCCNKMIQINYEQKTIPNITKN
jgi:hypothetical protein